MAITANGWEDFHRKLAALVDEPAPLKAPWNIPGLPGPPALLEPGHRDAVHLIAGDEGFACGMDIDCQTARWNGPLRTDFIADATCADCVDYALSEGWHHDYDGSLLPARLLAAYPDEWRPW